MSGWVLTEKGKKALEQADKIYKRIYEHIKYDYIFNSLAIASGSLGLPPNEKELKS